MKFSLNTNATDDPECETFRCEFRYSTNSLDSLMSTAKLLILLHYSSRWFYRLIFILLIFASSRLQAVTVTSVCDGNWSDSLVWDLGVPGPTDNVVIIHYITLDISVVISTPGDLYISGTGELCGPDTLQCAFAIDGPMSVGYLTVEGSSVNNAQLISSGGITVNGSWSVSDSACSGCTFSCAPVNTCAPPLRPFFCK